MNDDQPTPIEKPDGPPSGDPAAPLAASETPKPVCTPIAPPIVAKTALEGTVREREVALESELRKKDQRLAELEDENHRLKTPAPTPTPTVAAKKKASWLDGGTFFE